MTATTIDKDLLDLLNDLIETAKNGEYGFAKCAERVNAPALKDVLQRRADDCRHAAAELQQLVRAHGGTPADSGTVAGALHRGWVTMKDVLTPNSDHAVLEEAERGEDHALAQYRKALKAALPADVLAVVTRQLEGAKANHDQVKALRDSTKS